MIQINRPASVEHTLGRLNFGKRNSPCTALQDHGFLGAKAQKQAPVDVEMRMKSVDGACLSLSVRVLKIFSLLIASPRSRSCSGHNVVKSDFLHDSCLLTYGS